MHDYPVPAFEEHVKSITWAESVERDVQWWREFWRWQVNCSISFNSQIDWYGDCNLQGKSQARPRTFCSTQPLHIVCHWCSVRYCLCSGIFFLIYRCTDEQGFRIGDSCPSVHPTIKGRDLQKYLSNDSFDGLTGKVRFHRFWDPFSALYSIINIQLSPATETRLRKVTMGTWNKDSTPKLKIDTTNLRSENTVHFGVFLFNWMLARHSKGDHLAMLLGLP